MKNKKNSKSLLATIILTTSAILNFSGCNNLHYVPLLPDINYREKRPFGLFLSDIQHILKYPNEKSFTLLSESERHPISELERQYFVFKSNSKQD